MTPVAKAIWFIEANGSRVTTLDDVAIFAGVSPHHLAHAFARVTGHSVMSYARRRRLTLAAEDLSRGAPNILHVALEHGYGSHEAFTRAFRSEFGVTPEDARREPQTILAKRQERLIMPHTATIKLEEPRFETYGPFSAAGLAERFTPAGMQAVPQLWQKFAPYMGHVPGQRPDSGSLGICFDYQPDDGSLRYLAAVELIGPTHIEGPLCRVDVPRARYAVFFIAGHISTVGAAWGTIMNEWLPASGLKIAPTPSFEWYDHRYDPMTGTGGFEIWVPIA